ncbi:sugar phosphate isomerase/epimerase [uncultured Arcticibacterium sp.]|uniref:sugar phosphate isomerase/epimerase family protein n=1 Tax=uncultured Arcticibacterium sp. TaxID=2173042 RepID=UPI0030F998F7
MIKSIYSFLFLAALTMACSSGSSSEESKDKEPLFKGELGVQAYTFREQFKDTTRTLEQNLDLIAELGFTELEGGAPKGVSPEDFKKMCADRGISIPASGSSFNELEEDPQAVADRAKALGAKYVMCAWIPHDGTEGFNFGDAKKAVEVFNSAGKVLAENGLTFCYHDHGYEFKPNPDAEGTMMDYIIQNTNPEYVSFEMDVLWTMHGGGSDAPQALLKKYPNRWKLMHVKDLKKGVVGDGSGGTPAENDVVLGTGQANWPEILKLANEVGIEHYFIEDESEHEIENIPLSIAYLKSLEE